MNTYVRATGKTPEEAAPAVAAIYDAYFAPKKAPGITGDPKDPFGIFKAGPKPQ